MHELSKHVLSWGVVFFVTAWGLAIFGSAALDSVMRSDNPLVTRRGRVAFAFLLAIELLWTAYNFDSANTQRNPSTQSFWWSIVLGAGIPIAVMLGLVVRRAYAGHIGPLISAVLIAAALFVAFPLGFFPPGDALSGLGRFEHDHHALDVVALLIPTLILLASEVSRGYVEGPNVKEPHLLVRFRREVGVGGAIGITLFLWLLGANPATVLPVFGILIAIFFVYLWWIDRAAVRRVRRDLKR